MIQAIYNSCISITGSEEKSFSGIVITLCPFSYMVVFHVVIIRKILHFNLYLWITGPIRTKLVRSIH